MSLHKFEVKYRSWSEVTHTIETLCYLGKLKLISIKTTGRWFSKIHTIIVDAPSDEAWNRFHDATFHQWFGFNNLDDIRDIPKEVIPMAPVNYRHHKGGSFLPNQQPRNYLGSYVRTVG
jgi:hypothetical protein